MEETAEIEATRVEPAAEVSPEAEPGAVYDLHIKVPEEMRPILFNATQLAYQLGDIPKPALVYLMNLFIGWGLHIQKEKWLVRMGYR